jgi:hypothetical protein
MAMTPKEFVEAWKKGHVSDDMLKRLGAPVLAWEDRKHVIDDKK